MDLKTGRAKSQKRIDFEKAVKANDSISKDVEWSVACATMTQNEWYIKNQDESSVVDVATGLTTDEPLGIDFSGTSFTMVGDTIVSHDCTISSCQIIGVQQGTSPGDRSMELFIGYVPFTPGTPIEKTALIQSLGVESVVFEDDWKLTSKNLTTFNGKKINKNSLLYILIRMTSSGPTNTCSIKLNFSLTRRA